MNYVEAPNYGTDKKPSLFLAGGITNCEDWQAEAVGYLDRYDITIYNPRRADFDINDPNASEFQIEWEEEHLAKADAILFWFAGGESVQPITLFELGKHCRDNIVVGVDPDYSRGFDVRTQIRLVDPYKEIKSDLERTAFVGARLAIVGFNNRNK